MKNYSGILNKISSLFISISSLVIVTIIQVLCMLVTVMIMLMSGKISYDMIEKTLQDPYVLSVTMFMYAIIAAIIFGIGYMLVKKYYFKDTPAIPLFMGKASYIFLIILFGIVVQAVGNAFLSFANLAFSETELFKDYSSMMSSLNANAIMIIYAMFAGPICEELIFRGVILNSLRKGFGDRTAVIISSVLFGIFHMNIIQFIYATIFGIALGYTYLRRRRIIDSIVLHISINCIGAIIIGLMTTVFIIIYGEIIAYAMMAVLGIAGCILCVFFVENDKNKAKEKLRIQEPQQYE